jgi:large subunit ribosomal protein L1
MELKEALAELRKAEKCKFNQSIDLIINLKGIDVKRDNVSTIINIPHKIKDKKVCGFLTKKSDLVKTLTQPDFPKYKEKKPLKMLVKEYDFFIAVAPLMPSVATTFGKVLGPSGKMPSPQLGVLMKDDDASIKQLLEKISTSVKIRVKEPSVKISVGKESMKDEHLIENIQAIYNGLVSALPTKKENITNILIKTTMSKPVAVEMK